jgi:hypothetical protein
MIAAQPPSMRRNQVENRNTASEARRVEQLRATMPTAPTAPVTAISINASVQPTAPAVNAYVLDLSGEATMTSHDIIVIEDATIAPIDTVDLQALGPDVVALLLKALRMPPSCEDAVRAFNIDGRTLAIVQSPAEFEGLGLKMPIAKARLLFEDIQSFKAGGVPSSMISTETPTRNNSTIPVQAVASNGRGNYATATASLYPTVNAELASPSAPSYPMAAASSSMTVNNSNTSNSNSNSNAAVYRAEPMLSSASEIVSAIYQATRMGVVSSRDTQRRADESEKVLDAIPLYIAGDGTRQEELGSSKGFMENLILMLKQNVTSAKLAKKALTAIGLLCRHGEDISTMNRENINRICSAGEGDSMVVLVDAMNANMRSTDVAQEFCKIIMSIAATEVGVQTLLTSNASATLIAAIDANKFDQEVAMKGCGAIVNMASSGPSLTGKLVSAGACTAVCEVLRGHGQHHALLAVQACKAIIGLAKTEEYATFFGAAGACEAICSAFKSHVSVQAMAEAACGAIVNISFDHLENKKRLGLTGGCEVIIRAMNIHGQTSAVIAERGCAALMNLSYAINTNKPKIATKEGCEAIMGILTKYGENSKIIVKACGLVMNLTLQNATNSAMLIE